ncbi:MAG: STAS domain-containing protein [Velocimicrobium sp.]
MKANEKETVIADSKLRDQILNQIPNPVMAVNKDLEIMYINEAGTKLWNKELDDIVGKKCFEVFNFLHCGSDNCYVKKALENKKSFSARNEITIGNNKIPIEYHAVPLKDDNDEIIGGLEYILDITEQVRYEERLREQSNTIRQMSTPTIKLWEGVLVQPVVGVVDSMRAQHMMESMLNKIEETYSKVIILDIHGVAAVDTAVANHLIKITKATKLMGCECIISGISPAVAQTILQLGINMETIRTRSTLSDALSEAFAILNIEVNKLNK